MTNMMRFEIEIHEEGKFKPTCKRVEQRLLMMDGVKKVTLLTAVGDLIPKPHPSTKGGAR